MKFLFFLLMMTSTAFAHELPLKSYLSMQEALASDNFNAALSAHKTICDKELIHYKRDYKNCNKKFKDIDELRASFKPLSELYLKNGNKKEMKSLMKASCPMYPGKWVQRKGKIANPYYGKSMLECGEKI